MTPGSKLRLALDAERPLQLAGTPTAYCAKLAQRAGFSALYLSGAGVSNSSFGLPDLGITTLPDVCEEVRRVTSATDLPLLVDADTGWGSGFNIARATRDIAKAGAAGMHLEDQESAKRCGHRPNKKITSQAEMIARIRSAVDARTDDSFLIVARSDAYASEGLSGLIERGQAYAAAGADVYFAEALTSLEEFRQTAHHVNVPILANATEFGKTPYFTAAELGSVGVRLVIYPQSAFRAMSQAAVLVYTAIRQDGTQTSVLDLMQSRDELYQVLDYHAFERQLDRLNDQ